MASSRDIPLSEQHEFLDLAKEFSWAEVKKRILERPELVTVQPCGRWSALHQAAYGANENAVRFLLEHRAPISAMTRDGKTPLDVSKSQRVARILQSFAKSGSEDLKAECVKESEQPTEVKKFKVAAKAMKKAKGKMVGGKKSRQGQTKQSFGVQGAF